MSNELIIPSTLRGIYSITGWRGIVSHLLVNQVLKRDAEYALKLIAKINDRPTVGNLGNSHVHVSAYGSFQHSVGQVVLTAWAEGLPYLFVNDFNTTETNKRAEHLGKILGLPVGRGLELICMMAFDGTVNDPANKGKTYVCGKGGTPLEDIPELLAAFTTEVIEPDQQRMRDMGAKLSEAMTRYSIKNVGYEDVKASFGEGSMRTQVQERDYAQIVQERIWEMFSKDVSKRYEKLAEMGIKAAPDIPLPKIHKAIRSAFLKVGKPAYVSEASYITLPRAKELILTSGGMPCYPGHIETAAITDFEGDEAALPNRIKKAGFYLAEFVPTRNTLPYLARALPALVAAGIFPFAGTEHNESADPNYFPSVIPAASDGKITDDLVLYFNMGPLLSLAHERNPVMGKDGEFTGDPFDAIRTGQKIVEEMTGKKIPVYLGPSTTG